MLDEWYLARTGSVFETRLDTYAHRLMILLAVTSGKAAVDAEAMAATLALVRYQLEVRRECDPVDAENTMARVEERIRRQLARGSLTLAALKTKVNAVRVGLWIFDKALENLVRAGEVAVSKTKRYSLAPRKTDS